MNEPVYSDEELIEQFKCSINKARENREYYFDWIKKEINAVIQLINKYNKIYILGGLGARLIQISSNSYTQLSNDHNKQYKDKEEQENGLTDEDEALEVLIEYAMSISTSTPNNQNGIIASIEDIDAIRKRLLIIIRNIEFYELSADRLGSKTEFDHLLKWKLMIHSINVRGNGYYCHIVEIYKEMFEPHNKFLMQYYGFDSSDILEVINVIDILVASKIGNDIGAFNSWRRFDEWSSEKGEESIAKEDKHFMQKFLEDNPDLFNESDPLKVMLYTLDNVAGYNKIFWVIPKTNKQKKIFELLSQKFGENSQFIQGKFGGFPQADSLIYSKPLIKIDEKFYCFSTTLLFRNIFNITANLLQLADGVYYEQYFKGNAKLCSRDNYIERKAKKLFEKLLPNVKFYQSLKYKIIEDGMEKVPELDIIGISSESIYIIEVKAGELNKKHKRGAILGLKDRLKETINEGAYQCYRATKFIADNITPQFIYNENETANILEIDKSKSYNFYKIVITYEHFSTLSVNLKYLIDAGVLNPTYKWAWTLSLYDLMIFSELIENELDFIEYLNFRLSLYDMTNVDFTDEIDILGFFFDNRIIPLSEGNKKILMSSFKTSIDEYFKAKDLHDIRATKPFRKK